MDSTIKFTHNAAAPFNYPYRSEATIIKKLKCTRCSTPITVVVFKSGSVKAYDDEWEAQKLIAKRPVTVAEKNVDQAELDIDELETDILNLKEELAEDKKSVSIKQQIKDKNQLLPDLKKKLKTAENELRKEYRKFESLEDKYHRKVGKINNKFS